MGIWVHNIAVMLFVQTEILPVLLTHDEIANRIQLFCSILLFDCLSFTHINFFSSDRLSIIYSSVLLMFISSSESLSWRSSTLSLHIRIDEALIFEHISELEDDIFHDFCFFALIVINRDLKIMSNYYFLSLQLRKFSIQIFNSSYKRFISPLMKSKHYVSQK